MKIYINGKFLKQRITGVQRFAYEITKILLKNFKNYYIVVPKNCHFDKIEFPKEQIIFIGSGNINYWEQVCLPYFLKEQKNPLLLCLTGLGPFFYKNKILTIHDLSFWEHPDWFSYKYFIPYRLLTPISAKYSLKILTVSNFSKKVIVEKLKKKDYEIDVVYNGVNNCKCFIKSQEKKKYILSVGSVEPRKNIERLIRSFVKWNNSEYQLLIIGGNHKSFRKVNAIASDNIKFLGYVSEEALHAYYSEAELFVYPSLYEGFGIPPLEAMIHGTPVITSNTTSLPEVCSDSVIYVDPKSEDSFINAFEQLAKNKKLQNELILKGFENVKRFSWHKSALKVNQIINKI